MLGTRSIVGLLLSCLALPAMSLGGEEARAPTLALGGDVMLARLVDETIRAEGARHVWGDLLPLLREADLAFVNLECAIAEGGEPFLPERVFTFRAAPAALEALTVAGIDGVNLANNHAMDFRAPALLETLRRLDKAGIARVGAGADLDEAARPVLLKAGNLRIGFVGFADHFREYAATPKEAGTSVVPVSTSGEGFERVRRALAAARAAGADLVVFSMHWGPNMREVPTAPFRVFARAVIDAGADLFHGHSAHVFQGIEIHRGKPILYDTGDLLDDYAVRPDLRNDLQLLFLLSLAREGVQRIELVPLRIEQMQVNRAGPGDARWIAERIRRLSSEMGTEIGEEAGRLVVRLKR